MPTDFHTTRRVEFCDTDMAGIVHFANFFRFMEAAEQELLRSLGLSVRTTWEGQEVGFPRVSAECDYLAPALFEDVLDIAVRVAKIGTKSVTFGFVFTRDGTVLARGQVTTVCCRVGADGKIESIAIPLSYRTRLEQAARGS
jgi:YbgC/YbaW family acyl-CoA thioester hydrolase